MPIDPFASATELCADSAARRVGSRELLDHYIERVERFDPALNAVVVRNFEAARARADAADAALARGESWGPLHGLPMTVKESFDLEGFPSTWGSPELRDNVATSNAVVVERLLAAGAVVFGKTNVPLMLADFQSYNEVYGTTNNPWDTARGPGGSSGGSAAALAAGMTGLEFGSDIGGSIRNPAHYSGVYGLKPTWGVVPMRGHALPGVLTPSDISVVGPLARSAADLELAMAVAAGPDVIAAKGWKLDLARPEKTGWGDYRVAVWTDADHAPVDRAVSDRVQAVADTLARLGAMVDDRARPGLDPIRSHETYLYLLYSVLSGRGPEAEFEKAKRKAAALDPRDRSPGAIILRATAGHHRDWVAENEARTRLRYAWHAFFEAYDALVCPIAATPAFPHDQNPRFGERRLTVNGQEVPYFQQLFWAGLSGVAYLPSVVAPVGGGDLPIGVQIITGENRDRVAIDLARRLADEMGGFVAPPGYAQPPSAL